MKTLKASYIDSSQALRDLDEVDAQLNIFLQKGAQDKRTIHGLWVVRATLETVNDYLDPDFKVMITTGTEPIMGAILADNGFGDEMIIPHLVEPGSDIAFNRIIENTEQNFWIGDEVVISLPTLAGTIAAGGEISLIDISETTLQSSLSA